MTATFSTKLTERLGIDVPIVQTGMGWVAGPHLVKATAKAGGLGILASATMTLKELEEAIKSVRTHTDKPFGVNLRTDVADLTTRLALMIDANVTVASFAQAPSQKAIEKCHTAGLFVVPTIGAKRHAEKMAALGVDAVIAQGQEGGGHTGVVPTSLLVPQVADALAIHNSENPTRPVLLIAAGGFFDGRGLVAALAYGADGIAMGTRFLLSSDARVPLQVQERYLSTQVNQTVVTDCIDGAPQRVITTPLVDSLQKHSKFRSWIRSMRNAHRFKNETNATLFSLMQEGRKMKKGNDLTWSQVIMAANAPVMTKAGLVAGDPGVGVLPTGQVVGVIDSLPSVERIINNIVSDARSVLESLESI